MGAHVWGPAYLRDHILPHWRLSGWAPDWYAGFPMYIFYMVLPALLVVLLDVVLPYGVALKIVSALGMVALPVCCWAFGKLAGLPLPDPAAVRRRGDVLPLRRVLHDLRRQHRVDDGGGVLVLHRPVLSMLFLGVFAHGHADGQGARRSRPGSFALTGLCHLHRRHLRHRRPRSCCSSSGRTASAPATW